MKLFLNAVFFFLKEVGGKVNQFLIKQRNLFFVNELLQL